MRSADRVILAIETSCDETSAAVVVRRDGIAHLSSNIVASQVALHAATGGVVPEVAAREHIRPIVPTLDQALRRAGRRRLSQLDGLAVTYGPGLHTSLSVGVETAKALALVTGLPLLPIHHILGHVAANWNNRRPIFPALALVVSGGHTELILIRSPRHVRVLGHTRDDAAGEAFDKVAQLLGLGYPGGPAVSARAGSGRRRSYNLPRPMLNARNLDFSFAGLKTAVRYLVDADPSIVRSRRRVADLCADFETAVVDVLVEKTVRAATAYRPREVVLGGGVAANRQLRRRLSAAVRRLPWGPSYHQPPLNLCTDNAGMIGLAAAALAIRPLRRWSSVHVDPVATI